MRARRYLFAVRLAAATAALLGFVFLGISVAGTPPTNDTSYSVSVSPSVDGVEGGLVAAPWNTSQGDPSQGTPFYEQGSSSLFPYTPTNNSTYETTAGGVTEPNLAVYPGLNSATAGDAPYPSGVAGTPGPDDGYCSGGTASQESPPVSTQPSGVDLPFAPYYFPDVVRNADGTLTGYFDYRPKDTDEAITVATSSDHGLTWQTQGEALEQNAGDCPTADTNDDGQGHPFVMSSVDGGTNLYTLQRAAGDNTGVGLLVHPVTPSAADPLASLPADQAVGVDPNTFATTAANVPTVGGTPASIPVTTLGDTTASDDSPYDLAGPGTYEDVTASGGYEQGSIITCANTATSPSDELTGCTVTGSGLAVGSGDDLVQVIGTANPEAANSNQSSSHTYAIPNSSDQNTAASGGLGNLYLCDPDTEPPKSSTNAGCPIGTATFSNETNTTLSVLATNAPNRYYVDGQTIYCPSTGGGPPITNLHDCTTPNPSGLTISQGDAITADPIMPGNDQPADGDTQMTTGLIAPDGIVGTLPSYPGAQSGSTIVLYTEKILNYYIVGTVNGDISKSGNFQAAPVTLPLSASFTPPQTQAQWLNVQPSLTANEGLPAADQAPATGSFTVYVGVTDASGNFIQALNCTSWAPGSQTTGTQPPAGSVNLIGCNGQGTAAESIAAATDVGGANAAITADSVLAQIGEGKSGKTSGPTELFGNNEDLSLLRAADTYDGINFDDLGAISGSANGTGEDSGTYTDISNPNQQESPQNSANPTVGTLTPTAPTNIAPGGSDAIEMRYIGSRGTIITNPDGSDGMFLSGAWASDGDSDAFNQIFYSHSTDGEHWSVPQVILSTDYTFAASAAQDTQLAGNSYQPLGVSAYYSGRAYGPSVVQNPNGTLTMVFSGYRVPKGMPTDGDLYGTNSADRYTVGATDPALYRNILTATLDSQSSPAVGTSSALTDTAGAQPYGTQVTYTDTVSVPSPGTGIPTGHVAFYDGGVPISNCTAVALSDTSTDTATCTTTPSGSGMHAITASYGGDSNYAGSTGDYEQDVTPAPLTVEVSGGQTYGGTPTFDVAGYEGFVGTDNSSVVSGTLSGCTTSEGQYATVGSYSGTISGCGGLSATNYTISYSDDGFAVTPASLTAEISGSQTYGGTPTFQVAGYEGLLGTDTSGVVSGTLSGCTTGVAQFATVGSYDGTISGCGGLSATNYTISYADDGFAVTPASLTAEISGSQTYGGTPTFQVAGYEGLLGTDTSGVVSGTLSGCTTSVAQFATVGSYSGTISGCSGLSATNYTISYSDDGFAVTPASLTADITGGQKYGGTPTFQVASYQGLLGTDTSGVVSGTLSGCTTSEGQYAAVGFYSATISGCGGLSAANYTIDYVDDGFTVSSASLTAEISGSQTYGGTPTFQVAGYQGLLGTDTSGVVSGTLSGCTTSVTKYATVGSHSGTISGCGGLSATNYTISYADDGFTVSPASLTAEISGSQTYGGTPTFQVAGYQGLLGTDTSGVVSGTLSGCMTSVGKLAAAGSYSGTISGCSGLSATNYTISYSDDGFTVNAASTSIAYTGPQQASTASSFTPTASLSSSTPACEAGQPVTFTLSANPITGTSGTYTLEGATTGSGGTATGAAISTAHWENGSYTITVTYAGTDDCLTSTNSTAFAVSAAGVAAIGVGTYTVPSAGAVSFSFFAALLPPSTTRYVGELTVVNGGRWLFSGASVTSYTRSGANGTIAGTGTLYWWSPGKHGGGTWTLAASGVAYTAQFTASSKGVPGAFGIEIRYTPTAGQPSPLPNSAPITLSSGTIAQAS